MKFTETQIKYLAGLMDSDGSLCFHFTKYKDVYTVKLKLVLQQSLSVDHEGRFMNSLSEHCGFVQFIKVSREDKPNWSDAYRWTVTHNRDLNMLIPRLTKHMVIKAKHWQDMLEKLNSIYGKSVTEIEMNELKEFATKSRKNVGPLKPKKHPTWAWVAGYVDGDGCYYMRNRKKNWGISTELLVRVVAHVDDRVSLDLLHKAFGGRLVKETGRNINTFSWTRNLGNSDKSFAIHFLRKVHRHSQLKKHKIEKMLHFHLQRLNDQTATAEVIV